MRGTGWGGRGQVRVSAWVGGVSVSVRVRVWVGGRRGEGGWRLDGWGLNRFGGMGGRRVLVGGKGGGERWGGGWRVGAGVRVRMGVGVGVEVGVGNGVRVGVGTGVEVGRMMGVGVREVGWGLEREAGRGDGRRGRVREGEMGDFNLLTTQRWSQRKAGVPSTIRVSR